MPTTSENDEREERGHQSKFERRGRAFSKQLRHGLAELIGLAEIAMQRIADIASKLDVDGLIEAEVFTDLFNLFGGRIEADDLVHRIANEAEHRKRDDRDRQKNGDRLSQSSENECEHVGKLPDARRALHLKQSGAGKAPIKDEWPAPEEGAAATKPRRRDHQSLVIQLRMTELSAR